MSTDENYMSVVLDREWMMTLGVTDKQGSLFDEVERFCGEALAQNSIYAVLHRERDRLFPDELFADLFSDRGRRSVPPSVVATVMVMQRLEGLSDREAVERFTFDTRWRYAAGVGGYDNGNWECFAHTVLVDMRARLAASKDPKRIFNVTVQAAAAAGLVGARRVLDTTPLYDAVATMDTITLIRSALRGLLRVADDALEGELRAVLTSGDGYASAAKPQIDWDDAEAREALIDARARDGFACLALLDGRELAAAVAEAAQLLATVVGQDLEETEDGTLRIARGVAKDRVISTVDPEARHGHKTVHRGFDGYKGHVAVDPDSEIITATAVTPGSAGDATVAEELIGDLIGERNATGGGNAAGTNGNAQRPDSTEEPTVYGDAAYGTGGFLTHLAGNGITSRCKVQAPTNSGGLFPKDRFTIDLEHDVVSCPAGVTAHVHRHADGAGLASFGGACAACPLRAQCTNAKDGRTIGISRHEQHLADGRAAQRDPQWAADYQATRPKVERKLGHLMRRRHGGRRARVRGRLRVDADFNLLAAAQNLARLAGLGLRSARAGWEVATA
ncbi:MAG TPA: IS1182 family transposase [Acidimicrobiales bacterium]|nr:IS1182 family transposase [Acidimicrobiales bacterium]